MEDEQLSEIQEPSQTPQINYTSASSYSSVTPPATSLATYDSVAPLPVLGALCVAILLLIVIAIVRRRKSSSEGSSILLVGPSDAGKTAIHSALVFHQVLPSHTTLQVNDSFINVPSVEKQMPRTMRLIDVPGHPRIRDQFRDYLSDAKAVVFVADASTVARNGAAVAEHLHHILHALTSLPPSRIPPQLVILAHKSDALSTSSSSSNSALAVSRVRTILERELEKRRASQAGGVGIAQLGEDEDAEPLGGLECSGSGASGFNFKDWEGGEIDVLGSSVKVTRGTVDAEKALGTKDALDGLADFMQWLQAIP